MSVTTSLNQVDLETVGALVGKIQQDPEAARTTWTANIRWAGAFRSESQVRSFPPTASDEPAGLGGSDTAPNPVEQLLSALGNCLAVGYAANASAAGIAIKDLKIAVDGDVDLRSFLGLAPGHAGLFRNPGPRRPGHGRRRRRGGRAAPSSGGQFPGRPHSSGGRPGRDHPRLTGFDADRPTDGIPARPACPDT